MPSIKIFTSPSKTCMIIVYKIIILAKEKDAGRHNQKHTAA
jgi:hypothetical protein